MSKLTNIVLSIILVCVSFGLLIFNSIGECFISKNGQITLIVMGVISAYHTFLSFTFESMFGKVLDQTHQNIDKIDQKINLLNNAIPYSYLEKIEKKHGVNTKHTNNEIIIISNYLQETESSNIGKKFLNTIYSHITKNHVKYYYILPDNNMSKTKISTLESSLKEIHKRKKSSITGSISYKFDANLGYFIPTEYFDIVLYINCDDDGNPALLDGIDSCEGYYCFSKHRDNNLYLYQKIDCEKTLDMREKIIKDIKSYKNINFSDKQN